jgi:hypothetical protein
MRIADVNANQYQDFIDLCEKTECFLSSLSGKIGHDIYNQPDNQDNEDEGNDRVD